MLISMAHAQEAAADTAALMGEAGAVAPNSMVMQLAPFLVIMVIFYFLLIRPQQKRFKEHKAMLDALNKGDSVITSGGLVGKIDKIVDESEVVVDLGNGVKVTALRHTIQSKVEKEDKK